MSKAVAEAEKNESTWMIEGFPRTRVQALHLQKMKVIPDKFVNLTAARELTIAAIKKNGSYENDSEIENTCNEIVMH